MSLARPVHEWETLDESDPLHGRSWEVVAEHHGHTMTVVGRIDGTSMILVRCEPCGHEFRMAQPTVDRALRGR